MFSLVREAATGIQQTSHWHWTCPHYPDLVQPPEFTAALGELQVVETMHFVREEGVDRGAGGRGWRQSACRAARNLGTSSRHLESSTYTFSEPASPSIVLRQQGGK